MAQEAVNMAYIAQGLDLEVVLPLYSCYNYLLLLFLFFCLEVVFTYERSRLCRRASACHMLLVELYRVR